jgi:GNAT superfamily N-acetyltransferase
MFADEIISDILYRVSPPVANQALNDLFDAAWPDHTASDFELVLRHSLVYVCAYHREQLIGFVKIVWDGGIHAFLLDTTVHPDYQRRRIGQQLVRKAAIVTQAKGVHWLHVDYEPHLEHFYEECGFQHTKAGLIRLNGE